MNVDTVNEPRGFRRHVSTKQWQITLFSRTGTLQGQRWILEVRVSSPSEWLNIIHGRCFGAVPELWLLSSGVPEDPDVKLMMEGSTLRKVKSHSWKKQRHFCLLEDGSTIWYKSRWAGKGHSTCECRSTSSERHTEKSHTLKTDGFKTAHLSRSAGTNLGQLGVILHHLGYQFDPEYWMICWTGATKMLN